MSTFININSDIPFYMEYSDVRTAEFWVLLFQRNSLPVEVFPQQLKKRSNNPVNHLEKTDIYKHRCNKKMYKNNDLFTEGENKG